MVPIASCCSSCSPRALAVSPSWAHSSPDACKTSGVGLVPPHQPVPHVGPFVLMEAFLELQNPVEKQAKKEKRARER